MRKYVILLIIGSLICSSFFVLGDAKTLDERKTINIDPICVSKPILKQKDQYIEVSIEESNSYLMETGKPILPIITKTISLPYGSKIKNVEVTSIKINELMINNNIKPSSSPIPLNIMKTEKIELVEDKDVYKNDEFYPAEWFKYYVGSGLKQKDHVLYLTIQLYPIRYSPKNNIIKYCEYFEISIDYDEPSNTINFPDEYEMVIIAPSLFKEELQPFIDHKNNIGVTTILKTTEDIFNEYTGFDKPEQIKYFIKDAFDNWGIHYVLLCGGLNSLIKATPRDDPNQGSVDWYVPVRYTNLRMGGGIEDPGYISDLYYADIYDAEGNFSTWDKDRYGNSDGIYANWHFGAQRDIIDSYPDVYVGRLACRNEKEVNTMVSKIINYETQPVDPSWFNRIVLVGGDTFDDTDGGNYFEGEEENQKAIEYMDGFTPVKCWSSNRDSGGLVPEPDDVIASISEGCGFLFFAGHGSPEIWETHWAGGPFNREARTKAINWYDFLKLKNAEKLPVTVIGSCHGSQFNITALDCLNFWFNKIVDLFGLDDLKKPPVNTIMPTPECFDWFLTRVSNGGALSTIGNTGIGYGYTGNSGDLDGDGIDDPDCVERLGGYIETIFFRAYGVDNIDILGETWGSAVTSYNNIYPPMSSQTDCKTVQQWVLFGDPSLKIGGY